MPCDTPAGREFIQQRVDEQTAGGQGRLTGGGRGVGRAIAIGMAQAGAHVVVNDLGATLDGKPSQERPAQELATPASGVCNNEIFLFSSCGATRTPPIGPSIACFSNRGASS